MRHLTLALTLAAAPALALTPPAETFTDTIQVPVVNVEVTVTDRLGDPVTGLTRDDFRLYVDGEEVPVEYFSEAQEAATPDLAVDGTMPLPGEVAEVDGSGVNVLIYIDNLMTLARNRDLILGRLREDISSLGPRDRVAVAAYDGEEVEILTPWTAAGEDVDAALAEAMTRTSWGIRWIALRRSTTYVANWEGNASRRSLLAAATAMRAVERRGGRNVLLLVAGSWDPKELNRADQFSPWCFSEPCRGTGAFNILADTANLLDYAIYNIDVEGRDVDRNWAREKRLYATNAALAEYTGGRALTWGDRGRLFEVAVTEPLAYYSLGFTPRDAQRNRRYRIQVEVLRPDLRVRNQHSFVAASPERERELDLLHALLLEAEGRSPLLVELGPPLPLAGLEKSQPLTLSVPVGELAWRPADGGHQARFQVQIAYIDGKNRSSEVETHELTLDDAAPRAAGAVETYPFSVQLKRFRDYRVGVLVRDLQSDQVFSRIVEVPRGGG